MLWFWVVVLVALIGAIAVIASGRGDSMVDVFEDRPDASLPAGRPLNADDLHSVRLNTGVRGYRMDEVDALLARLEVEMLDREVQDAPPHDDLEAQASSESVVSEDEPLHGDLEAQPISASAVSADAPQGDEPGVEAGSESAVSEDEPRHKGLSEQQELPRDPAPSDARPEEGHRNP